MSRSYRKSPVITEQQGHPGRARFFKNWANKRIRRIKGSIGLKGSRFKKLTKAQYDICDYIFDFWDRNVWIPYYLEKDWKLWGK
jgi:hypothetical protein